MDCGYHRPEFTALLDKLRERFPEIQTLDSYADVVCGPFGSAIKLNDYVDSGVPLLRISNITPDGTLDTQNNVKFLTAGKSEELSSTQVFADDVIVSQRGTIGASAIVSSEYPLFNISANLIAIKDISELTPQFVQLYLASDLGKMQILRLQSGQVHPKINISDIKSILIPNVTNQDALIALMNAARSERKAKLAEADALMNDMDDFVMDTLGIAPPARDARKAFAVGFAGLRAEARLDSDYYHPERMEALRALSDESGALTVARLSEVAASEREQIKTPIENYLSLAHVQSDTGELSDASDTASGSCLVFRADDVLFARLRPYLNKVHRAERGGCCSTEFHVLRVLDRSALLPEYLAAALRSRVLLSQTVHMMTGNTHPRLTNEDVANLMIPIPNMDVQREIAAETVRRRETARRLRAQAEAGWQSAKRRFENKLLGGKGV